MGQCPENVLDRQGDLPGQPPLKVLRGTARYEQDWVDVTQVPPRIKPCERAPMAVSGRKLLGVPQPAKVEVLGPVSLEMTLRAAQADLVFDVPGQYRLRVIPEDPRWLPFETELSI